MKASPGGLGIGYGVRYHDMLFHSFEPDTDSLLASGSWLMPGPHYGGCAGPAFAWFYPTPCTHRLYLPDKKKNKTDIQDDCFDAPRCLDSSLPHSGTLMARILRGHGRGFTKASLILEVRMQRALPFRFDPCSIYPVWSQRLVFGVVPGGRLLCN
jgi:hypothetical protein